MAAAVADAEAGEDSTKKPLPTITSAWRLLVFHEGGSAAYPLPPNARLIIGRTEECDIRIAHESVSRRHAELNTQDGWRLTDLGSSNGTTVGATRLNQGESALLQPGVLTKLGDARIVIDWNGENRATPSTSSSSQPPPTPTNEAGGGDAMKRVLRLVDLVAKSALPVLLLGETGAGKGWLAEEIHRRSDRSAARFMSLNCAAMPESLLESELFGHERGAFTGAVSAKVGLLESAEGGTVFLDEIGEAPASTQAKLLHVLERNEVMRVGAVKSRPINVRFLAATNREIDTLIAAGAFRRDLYFRLAGIPLRVPPLRERTNELPMIARAFVAEARPLEIAPETLSLLASHAWTGNIRELRNVLARATLLCTGDVLLPEHILFDDVVFTGSSSAGGSSSISSISEEDKAPNQPVESAARRPLVDHVRDVERQRIASALERFQGHQGKAAEYLGVSRRTLTNKLNELDLPRPRKRS